jgi:hypothetical protein
MRNTFLRAILFASMTMFAAGAVATTMPAYAADKAADTGPKVSKAFSKPLSEANKALQAKDWPTAVTKLKEAELLPDGTDYDKWITEYYLSQALYHTNDHDGALAAALKALVLKDVPAEDHQMALDFALAIAIDNNNFAKMDELVKTYITPDSKQRPEVLHNITALYLNNNDFQNASLFAKRAVAAAQAAGKRPERGTYRALLIAQNRLKDTAGEVATARALANLYNSSEDWSQYLDFQMGMLGTKGAKGKSLEVGALFLGRLRLASGADSKAADYQDIAEVAEGQHLPGDAVKALDTASAKGALNGPKATALMAKVRAEAKRDEATLGLAEAAAAKAPKGDGDVSVAEGYYSYGRYADAERVAASAVAKGGAKQQEAYLLLGAAQAMQGKNTDASATLAKVTDAALGVAADAWVAYATRQPPAPASAQQ